MMMEESKYVQLEWDVIICYLINKEILDLDGMDQ